MPPLAKALSPDGEAIGPGGAARGGPRDRHSATSIIGLRIEQVVVGAEHIPQPVDGGVTDQKAARDQHALGRCLGLARKLIESDRAAAMVGAFRMAVTSGAPEPRLSRPPVVARYRGLVHQLPLRERS